MRQVATLSVLLAAALVGSYVTWTAPQGGVAAEGVLGRDPPLPVRRAGERHLGTLAGHGVGRLDRVADGEDVRVGGAEAVVHANAATRINREPPGFSTRMKSSSVASGSGTAVMTYCATTASKNWSGKARCFASITASASTLASFSSRTRCCARRNIGSEISTPHIFVLGE